MWNRVVGQIGQAWNPSQTDEQEDTGINGVSSTQSSSVEEADTLGKLEQDSESSTQQYKQVIASVENELSSARAKYDTLHTKFKSLQSSYETDLQAERSVIEALKEQIMQTDKEQIEANKQADSKFGRLKQQARTRINELSKEIDTLKLGLGADAKTGVTQEKFEESLNMSPSSSRASSPDRIQQELCEKEKELESVQNELTTLRQNNIELDTQLSQLQLQITQLEPLKNELKTSLTTVDRVELENTQLSNTIQDLTLKNSLLDSRINEVIEERKQCEDNLDQFKKYKLKEFQEVIHNKSDEIEALNNSLSLLRIEYADEKESRTKQDIQLSSLREDKELSRQRYQQLVLQVEGYTKEMEELKTAGKEREVLKDNQELTNTATDSVDDHLQEVNNLKAELRDCRKEIELKREEFLSKGSELCNQKQELEDVLLENDKLTNDVENYTKQLSEHTTKLEQMLSINTELSETISKLRKEVADAELAVNSSQTDLTASRDQVEQEKHTVNELEICYQKLTRKRLSYKYKSLS
ncbi:hypothetical protein LOD99_263 [Oopsacas minuta]|uniref:Uncharacterized protein n=1 Tax=Oopsacas minuta TaxID=111878 RepID=A0AAV7K9Q6_9METZ|nr:hypothetical protein LOD99_263 [Oopsacas minuta]